MQNDILSFNFPDGKVVKVYLVKLTDGKVVARTEEELEAMIKRGEKYEVITSK